MIHHLPSVPSERVANFSSSIDICPAKPALRSLNCFKFSNSAFFSLIRATRRGDWPEDVELALFPLEGWRRCEGRGRLELYMTASAMHVWPTAREGGVLEGLFSSLFLLMAK